MTFSNLKALTLALLVTACFSPADTRNKRFACARGFGD